MAATTVTGKGLGAADGQNKGSAHMTLGVGHLIGPRCVIVSEATLDTGAASEVWPALDGTVGDYIVIATDSDSAAANAVGASLAMDATSTTVSLVGTSAQTVAYSVIKKGLAI